MRVVLTHIFALSMGALVPREESKKHARVVLAQINTGCTRKNIPRKDIITAYRVVLVRD